MSDINKITSDKVVAVTGTSLAIRLTKELKMLGLKAGDVVRITIEKP